LVKKPDDQTANMLQFGQRVVSDDGETGESYRSTFASADTTVVPQFAGILNPPVAAYAVKFAFTPKQQLLFRLQLQEIRGFIESPLYGGFP